MSLVAVEGLPEVRPGDDLGSLLAEVLEGFTAPGDVLVVTHKVVSKAEGRVVELAGVTPSQVAARWSSRWNKDPRQVEIVLRESAGVVRMERGVIVSRTSHGFVCANAGVDRSNSPGETVCLLPLDPDESARLLHERLSSRLGFSLPVLISDSFGRPWRNGIVNVAVGVAGMLPLTDYRGQEDVHGYRMEASIMAVADALCAATELVMGKVSRVPAALVRGYPWQAGNGSARELVRPLHEDFFR